MVKETTVRTLIAVLLTLVALTLLMPTAKAQAATSAFIGGNVISKYEVVIGPYPSPYFLAFKKLGRGILNMGTAPIEVIKQPLLEAEKGEGVAEFLNGLFVYGVFTGVSWTFYRELDGIYALGTFYLPSLGPAIDPEYIF